MNNSKTNELLKDVKSNIIDASNALTNIESQLTTIQERERYDDGIVSHFKEMIWDLNNNVITQEDDDEHWLSVRNTTGSPILITQFNFVYETNNAKSTWYRSRIFDSATSGDQNFNFGTGDFYNNIDTSVFSNTANRVLLNYLKTTNTISSGTQYHLEFPVYLVVPDNHWFNLQFQCANGSNTGFKNMNGYVQYTSIAQ